MKNLIAIAVLVVLGVVAFLVLREPPKADNQQIIDVLKPLAADKVTGISVTRFEGTGKERAKESYTLEKKGSTWRMTAPVDFPVVETTVETMIKALGELRIIDVISEKKANHKRFEVDADNGIDVTVRSGKETLAHFIIGKAQEGVTFVRLPDKDTVYRLKGQMKYNFNRSMRLLRDKTMAKLDFDAITKVTFETAGETLVMEKSGKDKEAVVKPVGVEIKNFDNTKGVGLFRSIASLNALDFEDGEVPVATSGLGEGATKVIVETMKDGKPQEMTVLVGNEKTGKSYTYAKISDNKQVYLISNYTAKRFKAKADEYARTDEQMKQAERKETAKASAADSSGMPGGMPGAPGARPSPEIMKKVKEQLAKQQH